MSNSETEMDRGLCLCLSGGGFRATLFHLGALRRLNELGVLTRLSTVTSVSGGSILNGFLASRWRDLKLGPTGSFTNFGDVIAGPVRTFCMIDLRTPLVIGTRLNLKNLGVLFRDFFSISANFLAASYETSFKCRLVDLPAPGGKAPRFVFCATNVDTGACWHFHGGPDGRMGDFYTGYCSTKDFRLSDAIAASSAFPLAFSAFRLKVPADCEVSRIDPWGEERVISIKRGEASRMKAGDTVLLTDGGVYDNLGVEPIWNRYTSVLVSDAGQPFAVTSNSRQSVGSRLYRASLISMEQVGAVRKRWLVQDLVSKRRKGAAWALNSRLGDFPIGERKGYEENTCRLLHRVRTDLNSFSDGEMSCLENHGYSLADAAMRSHGRELTPNVDAPFEWPYPNWTAVETTLEALKNSAIRSYSADLWAYVRRSFA